MDVEREMPEFHALGRYYADHAGAFWVAEADGRVVGMIAIRRLDGSAAEICRLYVEPSLHGGGLGNALLDQAEAYAIATGAARLVLWSDTRFDRAHRFYEKRSYVRHGPIRVLDDISNSLEFGYAKPVDGIERLDIAAARSAAGRLACILATCVADGALMSFQASLQPEQAKSFWYRAATEVGSAQRVIVAAWRSGILSGVGMLDLGTPENQSHRAEVQELMVDPGARRGGLGRRIMRMLEREGVANGRLLLTATIRSDSAGAALLRDEDWREAEQTPGFVRGADDKLYTTAIFWKPIGQHLGDA